MVDLRRETERRIEARVDDGAGHERPDLVAELVAEYDAHVGQRDRFLRKLVHALLAHVTLSSVRPEHARAARNANENRAMANEADNRIYECTNTMLFPDADVDLVFSPAFDRDDLSVVRRVVRRAQTMARIGDWITTWERELQEGDFTSGVVVAALADGLVSSDELRALEDGAAPAESDRIVDAVDARGIEQDLVDAWDRNPRAARALAPESNSVDTERYLDGTGTVPRSHLASRGMK